MQHELFAITRIQTACLIVLTLLIGLGSAGLFVSQPTLGFSAEAGIGNLLRWLQVALLVTALGLVSFRFVLKFRTSFDELLFLLVLTCGVNFIVQLTGGTESFWLSLYFLVGGLAAVAFPLPFVALTAGVAVSLESANLLFHGGGTWVDLLRLLTVFAVSLTSLHVVSRSERRRANLAEDRLLRLNGSLAALGQDREGTSTTGPIEPLQQWERHLRNLLELAHFSLGAARTVLLEVETNADHFRVRAGYPSEKLPPEGRFPLAGSFVARALEDNTPLTLRDSDHPLPKMVWQMERNDDASLHLIPIVRAHASGWVLVVSHPDPDHFDDDRRVLAKAIGAQIAEVESLHLRQVRHQVEDNDNRRLLDASEELAKAHGVPDIVQHVARYASQLGEVTSCAICLLEDNREFYYVAYGEGYGREVTEKRYPLELATWAGWVLRAREEPLAIAMRRRSGMPVVSPDERGFHENAQFLAVPLRAPNRVIGALLLTRSGEPFSPRDIRFLRIHCNQAATAIENAMAYERVIRLAATDALTGLFNRRYLEQALGQELARRERSEGGLAVAMLDIDHFKRINDTYGHSMGDVVLKRVARALRTVLRKGDVLARFGGEEFVVLFPDATEAGASESAERMRATVAQAGLHPGGEEHRVTVSIGWSLSPRDGSEASELLRKADAALYLAKNGGRDRVASASELVPEPRGEAETLKS